MVKCFFISRHFVFGGWSYIWRNHFPLVDMFFWWGHLRLELSRNQVNMVYLCMYVRVLTFSSHIFCRLKKHYCHGQHFISAQCNGNQKFMNGSVRILSCCDHLFQYYGFDLL